MPTKNKTNPKLEALLTKVGRDWAKPIAKKDCEDGLGLRMYDRPTQLTRKNRFINRYLKEYMKGKGSVLDVACGSGTFLECMRYYGNEIMGTELRRFSYMESQSIPHIKHDCHDMPFPFEDGSYDLVTCQGAFGQLRPFMVPDIVGEFFRVASKTVLIRVNSTKIMEAFLTDLDSIPDGWRETFNDTIVVRYEKEN